MESGGQKGDLSHSCHSTHTTDPKRKRHTLHFQQKMILLYYTSRKKKRLLLAQCQLSQQETAITEPMKIHFTLNSQFPPGDSLFTTTPPKSINRHSSPLFLWICRWLSIRPQVLNFNSLLFWNKPILLERYLAVYLFKVNKYSQFISKPAILSHSPPSLTLPQPHFFFQMYLKFFKSQ